MVNAVTDLCGPNYVLNFNSAVFSAEHPHGMGSETKPEVIKIPRSIVRKQVLSVVSFFVWFLPFE